MEGRQGHKSGGEDHGCEGACYIANVDITTTPPKFYFQKQMYHGGSKYMHSSGMTTHPSAIEKVIGGGFKGMAFVIYGKKNGRSTGHDSAVLEIWWNEDPTADISKWVKVKSVEDKGGWGSGGDTCNGVKDQVITWSNIQHRYKSGTPDFSLHPIIKECEDGPVIHSIGGADMDFSACEARGYGKQSNMPRNFEQKAVFKFASNDGKCRLKNLSLREIDPTLAFEQVPTPPSGGGEVSGTTTLVGTLKFQQDINTYRTSACAGTGTGGGAGSGNSTFYDVSLSSVNHDTELSNTTTFQNRTRGVEIAKTISSGMIGNKLLQLDVHLKKAGSPGATPTVRAKIWNSSGSVVYTSPTALDPTTLTTSFTTKTFDFSTNTHVFVLGDRVGVEYITDSDTNYVLFGYVDVTSGFATVYANYEDGLWEEKPSRDLGCAMWE